MSAYSQAGPAATFSPLQLGSPGSTLDFDDTQSRPPSPKPGHRSKRQWTIYMLTSKDNGCSYVGLTCRDLRDRLRSHGYQARRHRRVRPGGLMHALRDVFAGGGTIDEAFHVEVVAQADTAAQAQELERAWIARTGCRQPHGYNDLPGGGIGGPAAAVPIEIRHEDGTGVWHDSVALAIVSRNSELQLMGKPIIQPGTVYARLGLGWSAAEALEYQLHRDGRGCREDFILGGATFSTLREASAASGVAVDTLRSRLHRRLQVGSTADLGLDARRSGETNRPRRNPALGLRLPGVTSDLTVAQYAQHSGIPKATVLHRWHAARRAGQDPAALSPTALLELLKTRVDRRCAVTLTLDDGRAWTGGERDLVRRVLGDEALEASRPERLCESGIRRRLRTLSEADRHVVAQIRWAFGFPAEEN